MCADAHQIHSTCLICVYRVLSMSVVLTSDVFQQSCFVVVDKYETVGAG